MTAGIRMVTKPRMWCSLPPSFNLTPAFSDGPSYSMRILPHLHFLNGFFLSFSFLFHLPYLVVFGRISLFLLAVLGCANYTLIYIYIYIYIYIHTALCI
jgi:hypothetical protein